MCLRNFTPHFVFASHCHFPDVSLNQFILSLLLFPYFSTSSSSSFSVPPLHRRRLRPLRLRHSRLISWRFLWLIDFYCEFIYTSDYDWTFFFHSPLTSATRLKSLIGSIRNWTKCSFLFRAHLVATQRNETRSSRRRASATFAQIRFPPISEHSALLETSHFSRFRHGRPVVLVVVATVDGALLQILSHYYHCSENCRCWKSIRARGVCVCVSAGGGRYDETRSKISLRKHM